MALHLVCLVGSGAAATCCCRELCQSVPPPRGAGQALAAAGCVGQRLSVWVMPPKVPSPRASAKLSPSAPSIWEVLPAPGGTVVLSCSLGCWHGTGPGATQGRSVLGEDVRQGCGCCLDYPTVAQVAIERRPTEKEDRKRHVDMAGLLCSISLNSSTMWNFTWH